MFVWSEAATRDVLWKKVFLEISQNSQENTCAIVSFLIKLQIEACNFIKKETLAQVFSSEFCEISKNIFFTEHLWTTVSLWLPFGSCRYYSQYSTFDFSNERYFDKSALDRVANRLLPKDCHALFPVFTKGDSNCLFNSVSLLLTGEQSQLSTELRIKVIGEMVKNTHNRYWFRKRLAARLVCSFDPWTTHSCKTKWKSTNTKKVRHYNFFAKIP